MVGIKQWFQPELQAWRRPALVLSAGMMVAALAGCAGTPQATGMDNSPVTPPLANFQSCAKPEWPQSDFTAGHNGTVTLSFLISAEGKPIDSKVVKSSGYPGLDEAARVGINKCSFKPAMQNGKPVEAWMKMQYVWTHA
jgi:bla regulator protein blaR1